MPVWEPDQKRFRELTLYVSEKCRDLPAFGAVKLNKILYYSDFLAYAMLGAPITGFEYRRLPNGPAPRHMQTIRRDMESRGELVVKEVPVKGGKTQHRTVPSRKPNTRLFTREQLDLVDSVIESLKSADAEKVSDLSHLELGWKAARPNETIPYGTILLSDRPLTDPEIRRIQDFAKGHGYATR